MSLIKYIWALRAIIYKLRFKSIGNFSYIGKPTFLLGTKKINIGDKVRIYPGARMEVHGDDGKITIQNNVSIGQNFHITSKDMNLVIGKDTTISGNVFITNIDHDYMEIGKHIMEQKYIIKETIIGENCFIGYGVGIQAGTVLGKQCIVGANAVVRGEFPDYCVIAGVPAKILKRYNPEAKEWEKYSY
ncbi:acyltransferase [Clostridium sp. KNHs214]|uniref:acyltransferase n=1 Tax=Clostridium sp. KNHs214 TaxID=1540257 RepID=UPI0005591BD8|nr:acyltransferase [Clostridium sp. KNHs214]